ncbi:hypothetical protein PPL_03404 [Heterostelium album PN500]|uniref:Uncharacterized protein n=1 Tax=Heterostelium pallidum (strain ATCC 26659 / Pp 5 / PN500) TaxID=670386 RepID=D3B4S8_HETP5|nr:hypothetical protein PPL_03404 [Heterostelium album PN500]EFA84326.1 hypothetical protein PPL_03404 [Heterostelium album PN500]|eukprot:XP_020436441.1 hypothetical protein PPL_03404 [Heterostelium album PN500]
MSNHKRNLVNKKQYEEVFAPYDESDQDSDESYEDSDESYEDSDESYEDQVDEVSQKINKIKIGNPTYYTPNKTITNWYDSKNKPTNIHELIREYLKDNISNGVEHFNVILIRTSNTDKNGATNKRIQKFLRQFGFVSTSSFSTGTSFIAPSTRDFPKAMPDEMKKISDEFHSDISENHDVHIT